MFSSTSCATAWMGPADGMSKGACGWAPTLAGYLQQKPLGFRASLPIPRRAVSLLPEVQSRWQKKRKHW